MAKVYLSDVTPIDGIDGSPMEPAAYDATGHCEHSPCFGPALRFSGDLACAVGCVVGIDK